MLPMPALENKSATDNLIELAAELGRRVGEYSEWRKRDLDVQGLRTRRDELQQLAGRSESLSQTRTWLAEDVELRSVEFAEVSVLRQKASEVGRRFAEDPASITKPKALEALKSEAILSRVTDALQLAWKNHVLPTGVGPGIESVLERYDRYRGVAAKIGSIRRELVTHAERLPGGTQVVARVRDLKLAGCGKSPVSYEFVHSG